MITIHNIISRVVFYGLLATFVVVAIPYGSVQPWWGALFECVVFVLGILGIVDLLITKEALPKSSRVALPILAFCLFLLLQSLPLFEFASPVIPGLRRAVSADPFTTQQLAIKLLALVIAGVLLLRYAKSDSRFRILTYVLIGIGIGSALFGLVRQGSGGPHWFFPLPKGARGFAQFVNRNHFGFLVEMTFGLAIGLAIRGAQGMKRGALLVMAAFLWVSLIIANSRGAILASLCQLLFLIILINPVISRAGHRSGASGLVRRFAVQAVLMIALISAFAYGVRWVGGEQVVSNLELTAEGFSEQGGHEHRENVSRRDMWRATWNLIKAHPVVGSGFGAYWIAITAYHDASGNFTPQEAHNDYLEFLAGGGLAALAICLWFGFRFVPEATAALRAPGRWISGAAFGAIVGLFGVMVHNSVDFGLHITINAVIFTALIAIVLLAAERRTQSNALQHADAHALVGTKG